jgi:hypothetical protein
MFMQVMEMFTLIYTHNWGGGGGEIIANIIFVGKLEGKR